MLSIKYYQINWRGRWMKIAVKFIGKSYFPSQTEKKKKSEVCILPSNDSTGKDLSIWNSMSFTEHPKSTLRSWHGHTWQDFDRLWNDLNVVKRTNNCHSIKWSLKECNFMLHANNFDVEPVLVHSLTHSSPFCSVSFFLHFFLSIYLYFIVIGL